MMYIREIVEYYRDDNEAEVLVSDGSFDLVCYLFPAKNLQVGQVVEVIYAFNCSNIVINSAGEYHVEKKGGYYSYVLTAKVVDRKNQLVIIGDLLIRIDVAIPADIMDGQYISFSVLRLDA